MLTTFMLLPFVAKAQYEWWTWIAPQDEPCTIRYKLAFIYDDYNKEGSDDYIDYRCGVVREYPYYDDDWNIQWDTCKYSGNITIPSTVYADQGSSWDAKWAMEVDPFYEMKDWVVSYIDQDAFKDCTGLTSISIPETVTYIGSDAFYGCTHLTKVTMLNPVPPTIYYDTFTNRANCRLFVPQGSKAAYEAADYWKDFQKIVEIDAPEDYVWLSSDSTTLTFCYDKYRTTRAGTTFDLNKLNRDQDFYISNAPAWSSEEITSKITKVVINPTFAFFLPKTTFMWFDGMSNLKTITGITNLNTSNVSDMTDMFKGCRSLSSLDVSRFNTSKVESMEGLFSGCRSLSELDVSSFDTGMAGSMNAMFSGCSNLSSIDVSGFNTSKVGDMNNMFWGCTKLTHIDVDKFDTSNLATMGWMFRSCSNVESLDLSKFDLDHSHYSYFMRGGEFSDCKKLKHLSLSLSVLRKMEESSCNGVGTPESPCLLDVPDGYDFGDIDTSADAFLWKKGYFKLGKYTDISQHDNAIFVGDATVKAGATTTLSVQMNNTLGVRGFQFDIVLPEGVTVATDADGLPLVALSTERTTPKKMNFFDAAVQADGSIRVLCNSNGAYTFDGTDGEVCAIDISVPEDIAPGLYSMTVRGIILTDADAKRYAVDGDFVTRLTVEDFIDGDANGDGTVDVADIAIAANYILGRNADGFAIRGADLNDDGAVDVSDLAAIANIILHGKANAPAKIRKGDASGGVRLVASAVDICGGATAEMALTLDNPTEAIASWQADLALPKGIDVAGIRMDGARRTDQTVDWEQHADGTTRLLCLSAGNQPFRQSQGVVAIVTLRADNTVLTGRHDCTLGNVVLTSGGNRLTASDAISPVNVSIGTGIEGAASAQTAGNECFTVGGTRVHQPRHGITIVRDATGQTRKIGMK